jgi:hypothetical protein
MCRSRLVRLFVLSLLGGFLAGVLVAVLLRRRRGMVERRRSPSPEHLQRSPRIVLAEGSS